MIIHVELSDDEADIQYNQIGQLDLDFNSIIFDWRKLQKVSELMRREIQVCDNRYFLNVYKMSFYASDAVKWMMKMLDLDREKAIFLGNLMKNQYLIHHVTESEKKFEGGRELFKFQIDEESPLNWKKVWIEDIDSNPCFIVQNLLTHLLNLYQNLYFSQEDSNPKTICELIRNCDTFLSFELFSCELQKVTVTTLPAEEQLAFWLNLYNLLALHSYIKYSDDTPLSFFSRKSFFTENKYIISGYHFSLDDIEHGILRGKYSQFSDDDIRSLFKLDTLDPRIHCVLNCFTESSPSYVVIDYTNIEKSLNFAVKRHIQNTSTIIPGAMTITKQFYWYLDDFKDTSVLDFIKQHLTEDQISLLGENPRIDYHTYDWKPSVKVEEIKCVLKKE